jgi:hypothetical protein
MQDSETRNHSIFVMGLVALLSAISIRPGIIPAALAATGHRIDRARLASPGKPTGMTLAGNVWVPGLRLSARPPVVAVICQPCR